MKKVLLTIAIVVIALMLVRSKTVREVIKEGPEPVLEKINDGLGDYRPDKIKQRMADGLKVDQTLANYRRKLDTSKKAKEDYLYTYCDDNNPQAHPQLDPNRQQKMCDYAREQLGLKL
jgi:hypothetical protein